MVLIASVSGHCLSITLLLVLMLASTMYVQVILSSVDVSKWPPFRKELLIRLTVYSLCNMYSLCVIYHFGFEDRIFVLIVLAPCHCLLNTLRNLNTIPVKNNVLLWNE